MNNKIDENIIKEISEMINQDFNDEKMIFLSGSLIEKIGNKFSDLDIFIITDNVSKLTLSNYDYDHNDLKIIFKEYNGIKCDIEIYNEDLIKENIKILNNHNFENKRILNVFSKIDTNLFLSFIHRMITGRYIKNEVELKKIVSEINLDKYFLVLKRFYQNQIENSYDDLVGNFYEKNYMTVILIGNMILPTLMAYFLAKKNVSIDRRKWAYEKLKALSNKDKESEFFLRKIDSFFLGKFKIEDYGKQLINFINQTLE